MKSKIWLSSPHMGLNELKYVNEAFETNWIAPLGPHVNAFENAGALKFSRDDIIAYDWNEKTIDTLNEYNSISYFSKPVVGNLILFPSWLSHSVFPNESQTKERISISFNIIYN
jgi:uncharacterized protein (TIGR02466 family)